MKTKLYKLAIISLLSVLGASCSNSVYQEAKFENFSNQISRQTFNDEYAKCVEKYLFKYLTVEAIPYYDEEAEEMSTYLSYSVHDNFEAVLSYSGYSTTTKQGSKTHDETFLKESNFKVDNKNGRAQGTIRNASTFWDKEKNKDEQNDKESKQYYSVVNESTIKSYIDDKLFFLNETDWYSILYSTIIWEFQTIRPIYLLNQYEFYSSTYSGDPNVEEGETEIDGSWYKDDNLFTFEYNQGSEELRIQIFFSDELFKVTTHLHVKGEAKPGPDTYFERENYGEVKITPLSESVEEYQPQ